MIQRLKQLFETGYRSSFVRNAAGIFGTNVAIMAIGLFASIISARGLGPTGKGLVAAVSSFYGIGVQFANIGLHSANVYNISRNQDAVKPAFADSFWLCIVSCCICALIYGVTLPLGGIVGLNPFLSAFALMMIPASLMLMFAENILLAAGDVANYNWASLGQSFLQLVFVAVLFGTGWLVPETSVLFTFLTTAIMMGFCILHIRKITGSLSFRFDFPYLRKSASYSFFSYLSCFFSYLLLRADVIITKMYLADAAVGQYSLAVNMSDMIGMVSNSIATLLIPKLSAIKSPTERKNAFVRILFWSGLLMGSISGAVILLSKPVVLLLYGQAYEPSVLPLKLLAAANMFRFAFSFLFQYLVSCGMIRKTVLPVALGTIVNFLLNFCLIQQMEIAGVALASLIAYVMVLIAVLPAAREEI